MRLLTLTKNIDNSEEENMMTSESFSPEQILMKSESHYCEYETNSNTLFHDKNEDDDVMEIIGSVGNILEDFTPEELHAQSLQEEEEVRHRFLNYIFSLLFFFVFFFCSSLIFNFGSSSPQ